MHVVLFFRRRERLLHRAMEKKAPLIAGITGQSPHPAEAQFEGRAKGIRQQEPFVERAMLANEVTNREGTERFRKRNHRIDLVARRPHRGEIIPARHREMDPGSTFFQGPHRRERHAGVAEGIWRTHEPQIGHRLSTARRLVKLSGSGHRKVIGLIAG